MADPITVTFTTTPESGVVPLTVNFVNTTVDGSGNPVNIANGASISWDFGDGNTDTTTDTPTHTYSIPGTYNVVLTIIWIGSYVSDPQPVVASDPTSNPGGVPNPSQVAFSPVFNDAQFFDNSGVPLTNGQLWTYASGGATVQQATFTNADGNIYNSNPIILDSSGRLPTELWLADGFEYNIVLTLGDGSTVLRACDNVSGNMPVPPGGTLGTEIWNPETTVPIYVSGNQFLIIGDVTGHYPVGNRVQYQFSDLTYGYGVVSAVTFDGTNTQVTMIIDSISFSNTVTSVSWSALVPINYTVDAYGVGYTSGFTYTGPNLGTQIQAIYALIASNATVYDTTYTTGYQVTPLVAATSYNGLTINVKFTTDSLSVPATLNISNLGDVSLKQLDSGGNQIDPFIKTGLVSQIMYDGTNLIIANPLPATPAGAITMFAMNAVPGGWLVCDGSAVSRTTYLTLFTAIGTTFGVGDGSTTFNLPNMLGQFMRGFDSGGTIDPGRTFGSTQAALSQAHIHGYGYESTDNNGFFTQASNSYNMANTPSYINWNGSGGYIGGGGTSNPMSMNLGTSNEFPTGLSDIRPTNVALLACIKY